MSLYQALLPRGFVTGHTRYVQSVKEYYRDGIHWLDAGGGRRLFHDPYDGEAELVARAGRVVVADADEQSLGDHETVAERVHCRLEKVPFPDASFDLITCGMVVEHLEKPAPCFAEFARLIRPGGKILIHTVNRWGYPTVLASASKILPFRRRLIALVTGRKEADIFPTHYNCNTAGTIRRLAAGVGLTVERLDYWNNSVLFARIPLVRAVEALTLRFLSARSLAGLR